jgi:hypothetical protein
MAKERVSLEQGNGIVHQGREGEKGRDTAVGGEQRVRVGLLAALRDE